MQGSTSSSLKKSACWSQMPLELIGAGFCRTGTDSTRTALAKLGLTAHHMVEVWADPKQRHLWGTIMKQKQALRDRSKLLGDVPWEELFALGKFNASLDFPSAIFYKELMAAYPDAKVLLTVRDSGEKWYESTYTTIYRATKDEGWPTGLLRLRYGMKWVDNIWNDYFGVDGGGMEDKEAMIARYYRHIEEVKRVVPKARLLVFNVKEGWGPLCKFLGKEIPHEPFPRVNSTAEFRAAVRVQKRRDRRVKRMVAACAVAFVAVAQIVRKQ